jgi:hypothetical protein
MLRSSLALSTVLFVGAAAHAAEKEYTRPFTLQNDTTKTVVRLFAATARYDGKTATGTLVADKLDLGPGKSTRVKLTLQRGECVYHMRAETAGGGELRAYDFDVCSLNATLKLTPPAPAASK